MIPYEDLVLSLHRWRDKQGLPNLTAAPAPSPMPAGFAPLPTTAYAAPVTPTPYSGVDTADELTSASVAPAPPRDDERTGELDLDTADVVEDEI